MINLLAIDYKKDGWGWSNCGNGGLAVYKESHILFTEDGELIITPSHGEFTGWQWDKDYNKITVPRRYASGMVISKRTFLFGHFTFEITLPNFRGAWPAIWLYPEDAGWLQEIDIVEQFRKDSWWTRFRTQIGIFRLQPDNVRRLTRARQARWFWPLDRRRHTYELTWTPKSIEVKVDGRVRFFTDDHKFRMPMPMNLVMNLAIGDWRPQNDRLESFIIHKATYEEI